jgi:predicted DNA-binding transcriptional regulator AlpA
MTTSLPAMIDVAWLTGSGPTYFRDSPNTLDGPAMLPDPTERPVLTAPEAFAELGIDRSTGYKAIRDGTFPVPIIRVGRLIRVPTVALRRLLMMQDRELDAGPDDELLEGPK